MPARKTASSKKNASSASTEAKVPSTRTYSPAASETVREEMHEFKEGKLRSGTSGKQVTDPKQAVAIGLSEARRSGNKVPPNPNRGKKRS